MSGSKKARRKGGRRIKILLGFITPNRSRASSSRGGGKRSAAHLERDGGERRAHATVERGGALGAEDAAEQRGGGRGAPGAAVIPGLAGGGGCCRRMRSVSSGCPASTPAMPPTPPATNSFPQLLAKNSGQNSIDTNRNQQRPSKNGRPAALPLHGDIERNKKKKKAFLTRFNAKENRARGMGGRRRRRWHGRRGGGSPDRGVGWGEGRGICGRARWDWREGNGQALFSRERRGARVDSARLLVIREYSCSSSNLLRLA